MDRMIIYNGLCGLKATTETNYNARIMNERLVNDFSAFDSFQAVKEYLVKYCGMNEDDIVTKECVK